MASANDIAGLVRFLTNDAKLPLRAAMELTKELQGLKLATVESLSKAKPEDIASCAGEKEAKQVINAAKRVSKKRKAGDATATSSPKKSKKAANAGVPDAPKDLEAELELPTSTLNDDELAEVVTYSNRAPLLLAFTSVLLKYAMPDQPLSSRLSLAQAYIATSSRSRAVNLGIQTLERGELEAEQKLAEGQPMVTVMGKQLPVLKRWGYEWSRTKEVSASAGLGGEAPDDQADQVAVEHASEAEHVEGSTEEQPALWALDLEALRKSNRYDISTANTKAGNNSGLPIYTPQSARAYLLKAFEVPQNNKASKMTTSQRVAGREKNLGSLLRALELLYASWAEVLQPDELEKRTWGWYVKVRPDVAEGAAGWGGKGEIKLADILALRRVADT